jgi:predicted Zn-dependent protease
MYYSRGMESQADYLGVETMYRAGYNPEGMVTFFQKLDSVKQQQPSKLAKFFSSHPLTSERIQSVRDEIGKLPAKNWPLDGSAEFQKIKARVQKL